MNDAHMLDRVLTSSATMGERLRLFNGVGPGFDFVRVALAVGVVAAHAPTNTWGLESDATQTPVWWVLFDGILPMFFGLSGFLVAASAQRLDLRNFALNRGLRIIPALLVEIVLSALILGPIVTSMQLSSYFSSREFFAYFENILGLIHYRLPGVFHNNPTPEVVNGSLWTVPHEILCYLILAGVIYRGKARSAVGLVTIACCFAIGTTLIRVTSAKFEYFGYDPYLFYIFFHGDLGAPLVPCFLIGATIYAARDKVPYNGWIVLVAIIILFSCGIFAAPSIWSNPIIAVLLSSMSVYIAVYIGLTRMPRLPFFHRGDYSYGIYLYHFPIQQTVMHFFPNLTSVLLMFLISFALSTLFAVFSWHFIEKPVLKLRKGLSFIGRLEGPRSTSRDRGTSFHQASKKR